MDSADYVIVGGGSTGCVMASRLSEDGTAQVVLLEEGPRDLNPYIHIPGAYYKTAQGPLLKRFPWEPTDAQNRQEQPTMVQASVLGGGSSVNAMIYIRGNPDDYARWEELGRPAGAMAMCCPISARPRITIAFATPPMALAGRWGFRISTISIR